jgi:lysophospholipase L1-like esterase
MRDFPWRTALTIAITGVVLAATHNPRPPAPPAPPEPLAPATPKVVAVPVSPVFDDTGLDSFYAALTRTGRKQGVTRIVHYGDSPTTADLITGDVRALLQARFGDAGHGFILVDKPWAWYQHDRVRLSGTGWKSSPASRFIAGDGFFGLGGVSFTGGMKASTRIRFESGAYTNFELWYERQPEGGTVALTADEVPIGTVDTSGQTREPGFASLEAPAPASTLELGVTSGTVRAFGISATRPGPGVVYDSLGLNGASVTVMTRMFNQQHWTSELQHRKPDLVIINYGTNEADFPDFVEKQYEKELRTAIARLRAALPESALLVMSPMDRGHRTGPGQIDTMPTIPCIVEIQRRVARETGCGFFDTFQAMGGAGTMSRWYAQQPRLVSADFIHPYLAGGRIIAEAFVKELEDGLARFEARR